jgi:hypothetical protein
MAKKSETAPTFPAVSVIERRIATGDANQLRRVHVELTNQPEPMEVRTVNTTMPGRYYQVVNDLGWVPVEPHEVMGGLTGDLREDAGRVVLGEGGKEVLVKMPTRYRQQIQHAKEARLHKQMASKAGFQARVQQSLERDAAGTTRAGAESLERQAEGLGAMRLDEFQVTRERVPVGE